MCSRYITFPIFSEKNGLLQVGPKNAWNRDPEWTVHDPPLCPAVGWRTCRARKIPGSRHKPSIRLELENWANNTMGHIMDSQTASPNLNTLKEHWSKTPQKPAFPLGDVRKWSNSSKIDERNGAILASVTINTSDRNFDSHPSLSSKSHFQSTLQTLAPQHMPHL